MSKNKELKNAMLNGVMLLNILLRGCLIGCYGN